MHSPVRTASSNSARPQRRRRILGVIIATNVVLSLVLAGCSKDASTKSGASGAAASESDPNAGLRTGARMKTALLTAKDLPARYKVDSDVVRDSADVFGPPGKVVAPTRASCKELQTNVWIQAAGVDSASFAQTSYSDSFGSEIDAEIESYRGSDAKKVMTNVRKLLTTCSKFKMTVEGAGRATIKVVTKAGPKVGDASIKAVMTSPVWEGGTTVIAVRVGTEVVSILSSSAENDGGAAATKLARLMVRRLNQSE